MRDDRRRHDDEDEEPKIIEGAESRRVRGRGDMRMRGSGRGGPPMGGRGDFRGSMGSASFMPNTDNGAQAQGFNNNQDME